MDIVLISGKMGSGKTTTAKALGKQARLSGKYYFIHELKFADTLYDIHDLVLDRMEKLSGVARVKKDGTLLQLLGTEWGRKTFGENIWVDIVKKKIEAIKKEFNDGKSLTVIDDCRFENEFSAFPEALLVRLTACESVRKSRAESWRENTTHPSEVGLDFFQDQGFFDLTLATDIPVSSPDHCATLIMAQLIKKNWIEKRS